VDAYHRSSREWRWAGLESSRGGDPSCGLRAGGDPPRSRGGRECHTRFPKKTECISYVCHNHNFTHMIDK
jgi:hypothetical protein